jgi:hypothetical protein
MVGAKRGPDARRRANVELSLLRYYLQRHAHRRRRQYKTAALSSFILASAALACRSVLRPTLKKRSSLNATIIATGIAGIATETSDVTTIGSHRGRDLD